MTATRASRRRSALAAVLALAAAMLFAAPAFADDPQDTSGAQVTGVEWTGVEWTGPVDTSGGVDPGSDGRAGFVPVPLGIEWTRAALIPGGASANGVEWTQ